MYFNGIILTRKIAWHLNIRYFLRDQLYQVWEKIWYFTTDEMVAYMYTETFQGVDVRRFGVLIMNYTVEISEDLTEGMTQ